MSAAPFITAFGGDLTAADYQNLLSRWITSEWVDKAGLRSVDSFTGQQMFGRKRGDISQRSALGADLCARVPRPLVPPRS